MCFRHYDRHLAIRIGYHNVDMFNSLTLKINDLSVCKNRDIVDFNVGNKFVTPHMHRKIYTRRRGMYAFRDQFLTILHYPDEKVINNWRREIKDVDYKNGPEKTTKTQA